MSHGRIVVIGGSVAGLSTALFLARRGHPVVVFERDGGQLPETLRDIHTWKRSPTPQAEHSHAFLARARQLLRDEIPDVLDDLVASGAREIPLAESLPASDLGMTPDDSDRDLVAIASRRATFEWVLRRAVAAEPNIELATGRVATGLLVDTGRRVPAVLGVRVGTEEVYADAVVDASGRRTPVDGWLAEGGVVAPQVRREECGIAYYSRFYQWRSSGPPPSLNRGYNGGGSFDRYSCLVFPADNSAFSITFGVLPEDRGFRALRDPDAFDAAVRSIPVAAAWMESEGGAAISNVASMTGLANEVRRLVVDDRPVVIGLHKVGDAAATTNPAHSRGCTLALEHARSFADLIDRHPDRGIDQTMAMDLVLHDVLVPWVVDSITQDSQRLHRWRPGAPAPDDLGPDAVSNGDAYLAAQTDEVVWRRFTRAQQLMEHPRAVLEDPGVVERVRAVVAGRWRPPSLVAPSHDDLVAIMADAADSEGRPSQPRYLAS